MKALVVDDHPLIQEAVGNVLRQIDAGAEIAVANDAERGFALAGDGQGHDVVLLDLDLPGLSGIAALKRLRREIPDVPVVILSATDQPSTVIATIEAGAAGFIPKSSSNEVMVNALRLVLAGGRYLPPQVLAAPARTPANGPDALGLSARQVDVLHHIARGASNKVICRELGLAERTVKAHVTAILRALNVSSRTQAALEAARRGYGGTPDAPSAKAKRTC
jgi:DNA-binding NarL/FixJ family response regulator